MQTISVQIQDNYIQDFMNYIKNHSENITIVKDQNLQYDPYFYERQKELHQIKDNIDSGKIDMTPHTTIWKNIKKHLVNDNENHL